MLRKNEYLKYPMEPNRSHVAVENKKHLSKNLINLGNIKTINMKNYINNKTKGEHIKLMCVYATEEEDIESGKLENKTMEEIKVMIYTELEKLPLEQKQLQEDMFRKNVKNKRKQEYIQFFTGLCEFIEEKQPQ